LKALKADFEAHSHSVNPKAVIGTVAKQAEGPIPVTLEDLDQAMDCMADNAKRCMANNMKRQIYERDQRNRELIKEAVAKAAMEAAMRAVDSIREEMRTEWRRIVIVVLLVVCCLLQCQPSSLKDH
jgi:hypothetical protein